VERGARVRGVATAALASPLRVLETTHVPIEDVLEGTQISLAELSSRSARITWEDFATVLERLEVIAGGPEAFERAAGDHG
jgi:hypothetical protein